MSALQLIPLNENELPHAGPMRWVSAVAGDADFSRAQTVVTIGHDFPFLSADELLPTALLELMAQTAAAAWALKGRTTHQRVARGYLAAVKHFAIHAAVRVTEQGAALRIVATCEKTFEKLALGHFEVWHGTTLAAEARMTFHIEFE